MPLMSPPALAADFWSAGSLPDVEQESFLAALEPAEQAALRERGTVRRFASGAALFHEQTVPSSVSILIDGRVKLTRVTADGRDVLLAIRGPGDVLGEQSAIDGRAALGDRGRARAGRSAESHGGRLHQLRRSHPERRDIHDAVAVGAPARRRRQAGRLRGPGHARPASPRGSSSSASATAPSTPTATATTGLRIDLAITQEDLAAWTGTSREGVSRALQTLRSLNWVETGRRSIVILDLDALRGRSA